MASTYMVSVQVWCESPEEAVRRTIIPGCVKVAEVQDLAHQIQFPPMYPVPDAPVPDDVLPL